MTISFELPKSQSHPPKMPSMLKVMQAWWVSPFLRCIRLDVSNADFGFSDLPAAWLKLFLDENGHRGGTGRAYTIRRDDRNSGTIDIEFVIHGEGPLSSWAARAAPGAVIHGVGSRGGYKLPGRARRIIMLGDPSSTPAILRIIETLPRDVAINAFIETGVGQEPPAFIEGRAGINWITRPNGARCGASLLNALSDIEIASDCAVWVAAESAVVDIIRRRLLDVQGISRGLLSASGYWKIGNVDYRDPDADWGGPTAAVACG